MGTYVIVVLAMLAWIGILAYFSARITKTGNVKAVFRLGRFDRVLRPGLRFIIPLIEWTEEYPTQTKQFELPDEPENIDRDHKTPEKGKTLPIRIVHKGFREAYFYVRKGYDPKNPGDVDPFDNTVPLEDLKKVRFHQLPKVTQKALEDDLVNVPLTSEISAVFEWHLDGDNETILNFIKNVDPEGGRDRVQEVRKRASDMVAKVLQEFVSISTLGHTIYMAPNLSRRIKEEIERLVGELGTTRAQESDRRSWGIQVDDFYLKPIDPGKTVNTGRADAEVKKYDAVRKSEGDAIATVNQGKAEKQRLIDEGEGERRKQMALNKAAADRITNVTTPAGASPEIAANFRADRQAEAFENNETLTTLVIGSGAVPTVPVVNDCK